MANLTPRQESIDRNHRAHQNRGLRIDDNCPECKRASRAPYHDYGTDRAKAYNAIHGTNVFNNGSLDKLLANEAELKRMEQSS